MVRPKASPEKLDLALCFANAVTIEKEEKNKLQLPVDRHGDATIFSVLRNCLPILVDSLFRDSVSETQLNKHLKANGYHPFRQRQRIKGTSNLWKKGRLCWKNRRWVDPSDDDDLSNLRNRITELNTYFPSAKVKLCKVIDNILFAVARSHKSTGAIRREAVRSHQLILGEKEMRPSATLRRISPDYAILAHYYYQVRALNLTYVSMNLHPQ